jgi:hypothetical protein
MASRLLVNIACVGLHEATPGLPASWGKYREFLDSGYPMPKFPLGNTRPVNHLKIKFPTQWNRELIRLQQGIKSAHQGRFFGIREG